ncbi:xanthine dehydrogenase family protein molybdopterin-binding subunit [Sphaerisporangium rubeum]|uniref:Xanthine dehydrogenase YagR molybdenum-binding subunit n=1 Tax=Sphaerisporangium rubeum TaxID=321317 RepID=A0A7X0IF36_9ACTN|nr:xanthine dehydrogenase family protein molybdopterin-binding subunit [Sphaerisporangium rubeum]MBB6474056.1 xanthine dehydrogenase YagR molybdenum-binding subunit [Sphaerisporangium rubeum]
MTVTRPCHLGAPIERVDGLAKVRGEARYAYENTPDSAVYAVPVQATVARGEVTRVDVDAVLSSPGVIAAMWYANAPRLATGEDAEPAVLQSRRVAYRGQYVAAVIAATYEQAREAARTLHVEYTAEPHDVGLRDGHPGLYRPGSVNPGLPADTLKGDPEAALASAPVVVDETYRTPAEHHNPMEPHATVALWDGDGLTIYDSTQGTYATRDQIASLFGLPPGNVRVVSPYVGGGFGSKLSPHPHVVLAVLAAKQVGRPVKVAVTRHEMFAVTGYRTPTIQRVRLGAERDGRLVAITHDVVEQTSTVGEFAEQAAAPTRLMYAAPHRSTTHRLVRLDVPTPTWMRAPGEAPGMFALESAMDELAAACGVDPVELRLRNEPATEPESGLPFSSRGLVACLREGARRFGWHGRDPRPGTRRSGRLYTGTGVASSTYPVIRRRSRAEARAEPGGTFTVRVAAAEIGTGARTVLTQIAADTLGAPLTAVRVEVGDSALPLAPLAGGSMGTASWGTAVVRACEALKEELEARGGEVPPQGVEAAADTGEEIRAQEKYARHAFGAQFAEVTVDADTGETRVPRLLGVFAVGHVLNPRTARSQFVGGMTMGLSMALMEESVLDTEFGDYLNNDLAQYHIASCADVRDIDAVWVDEEDPHLNPMGSKGIGEIGIVGTAAAIANAVYHATGVRVRDLPITLDKLIR